MSNEDLNEKLTNTIVENLNLCTKFCVELEKRLKNLENLVEKMIHPLNDLKKIMLD